MVTLCKEKKSFLNMESTNNITNHFRQTKPSEAVSKLEFIPEDERTPMQELAIILFKKRVELGYGLANMAALLDVSPTTIRTWESGDQGRGLNISSIEKLAELLGYSMPALIKRIYKEVPHNEEKGVTDYERILEKLANLDPDQLADVISVCAENISKRLKILKYNKQIQKDIIVLKQEDEDKKTDAI